MRILVNTETKLQQALEAIKESSIVVLDTETNGLELWGKNHIVGIAVYCDFDRNSYYIPFAHGVGTFEGTTKTKANAEKTRLTNERYYKLLLDYDQLPGHVVGDALKVVLTRNKVYLMHNAQFDLTALLQWGIDLKGAKVYDTMLAARVLYSDFNRSYFKMPDTKEYERGSNQLKWLSRLFGLVSKNSAGFVGDEWVLDQEMRNLKARLGKNTLNLDIKKHLWSLAPETVAPYACMDVELTMKLHQRLLAELGSWDQVGVYELMCEHQVNVAWPMHCNGFMVDHKRGQELLEEYELERAELLKGINFNINSALQIKKYALLNGVELPLTSKGNPKTDRATLKKYAGELPIFQSVLAVRALDKNVGTYIKKWLENTTPDDPLHPNFNVIGTVTGRWSSSDKIAGNLQNIPKDTKLKYSPKKLLLPVSPDHYLVEIDYSQLEMRVGAWVAETIVGQGQDLTLTNLILDGTDMHAYTRDKAGIPEILLGGRSIDEYMEIERGHDLSQYENEEEITAAFMDYARFVAKVPNFAAMYGGGWQALTNILEGITEAQAREIMEGWKETYPTVVRAMTALTREAMEWRIKPNSDLEYSQYNPPKFYQYLQYPPEIVPFIRKWSYYRETEKQEKSKDAFNSIVQGSSGFICVESINRTLRVSKRIFPITPQATVHDSFIFSTTKKGLEAIPEIVNIMTDWPVYPPLQCDVEIAPKGKSWGDKATF
jgi:DNA polymerase I-like protein with 3'-5' exonuclease and polymerase domains